MKPVLGVIANVTVLTALLIFFGWRRNDVESKQLGIGESVFGASTRDYVLRSVGSARNLLIAAGIIGLVWVILDRWLVPLVRNHGDDKKVVWLLRVMSVVWVVPTVLAIVNRKSESPTFHILCPLAIALGLMLMLYASHLRQLDQALDDHARRRNLVLQLSGALLIGSCLFWSVSNYAAYDGQRTARRLNVAAMASIAVHSTTRLHLEGPGVVQTELSEVEGDFRFLYTGLRLLVYSDGKYFLVSDGWKPGKGVVFVMTDDTAEVRYEFVSGA